MSDARDLVIPAGGLELEARLHLPDGAGPHAGVIVCHPHPQYGGEMHNSVVVAVCDALCSAGIAALRFNFRGVGRSSGAYDGGRGEVDDARAAVAYLAGLPEIDGARVGLAGYSFGALMALAAADASVTALALISPPLKGLDRSRIEAFPGALLLVAGDDDWVTPEGEFWELTRTLSRAAEAQIVGGADHSWLGYERELGALVAPFFAKQMTRSGAG